MSDYILAADPGKKGGLALLSTTTSALHLMPTPLVSDGRDDGKNGLRVDGPGIVANVFKLIRKLEGGIKCVVMEDIHALMGASANNTFEFGEANGALRCALGVIAQAYNTDVRMVQPKKWQRTAWKGIVKITNPMIDPNTGEPRILKNGSIRQKTDTKATSLLAAESIFPSETFVMPRCRKPHDGCVDAALIAYYAKVNLI